MRVCALAVLLFAVGCKGSSPAGTPDGGDPDAGGAPDGGGVPDAGPGLDGGASVLQHHGNATRDGLYLDAAFTRAAAAGIKRDTAFDGAVTGNVHAQPLYVEGGGAWPDALIVVTGSNQVSAIDPATGGAFWRRTLATPVPLARLPCGNIDPMGITGTPAVDPATRTVYFSAMTTPDGGTTHRHVIYALSLDDGSTLAGWPLDVQARVAGFDSTVHGQRGALLLLVGTLFVPYGGHFGDCGSYRGWVVAVPLSDPQSPRSFRTRAHGGGIWAPGGLASDGASVFAATGNTIGTGGTFGDGEAILRLPATGPLTPADFFAPANWVSLDNADIDLGGSGPLLVRVPGATPADVVIALGKDGRAYVLDRARLGGIGGELSSAQVARGAIIQAAAAYTAASGTYVAFRGSGQSGTRCPADLAAFRLTAASPPVAQPAWCASQNGAGSPMVTSTGPGGDILVWSVGAAGDNRLRAFDGETGATVFNGGTSADAAPGVRRFATPIAARGRIYVAGDGRLTAFTLR